MRKNYQLITDEEIKKIELNGIRPKLLLHSCCGPCSSYVLEYLSKYFDITVLFYNPNIYPESEYSKRLEEQFKLIEKADFEGNIEVMQAGYDYGKFLKAVNGLEEEREGGKRCFECFKLRLFETAKTAKEYGFDYFASTLTVSPHKNADILNNIGLELEREFNIKYLVSDFKKKDGYKRSIELSKRFGLYRQNYCGCEFSVWFD
ncbi:epoxyqueuosine reductase QueH [Anaerotignum faecicola]|nr:epoxyqueuosine reductase QueH [Anaerotignum faecicola]